MNQKEKLGILIVIIGLVLSFSAFVDKDVFDCYQPMFSSQYSCAISGENCINTLQKAGITDFIYTFSISEKKCTLIDCKTKPNDLKHAKGACQ